MKFAKTTEEKIRIALAAGAEIVSNRNIRYTGQRDGYVRVEKLAQTNGGKWFYPKRIVWACYRS